MRHVRSFILVMIVMSPTFGVQAQDKDAKLFANWIKLCQGGKEVGGAGSIGDTILNCPEDDIEAKAAKSQIRNLALSICADANKSCTSNATRLFEEMQCGPLLSVQRSEKCSGTTATSRSSNDELAFRLGTYIRTKPDVGAAYKRYQSNSDLFLMEFAASKRGSAKIDDPIKMALDVKGSYESIKWLKDTTRLLMSSASIKDGIGKAVGVIRAYSREIPAGLVIDTLILNEKIGILPATAGPENERILVAQYEMSSAWRDFVGAVMSHDREVGNWLSPATTAYDRFYQVMASNANIKPATPRIGAGSR